MSRPWRPRRCLRSLLIERWTFLTINISVDIFECAVPKQRLEPGYDLSYVLGSQETCRLSSQIPYPIGEHGGVTMAGATVGPSLH